MISRGIGAPSAAEASAETALLAAIAAKDSDNDGLRDWEEALYGADPSLTDSFKLGMTDGQAVAKGLVIPKAISELSTVGTPGSAVSSDPSLSPAPAEGTLTDAFAKTFFSRYVSAKQTNGGADFSNDEVAALMKEAMSSLSSLVIAAPDFKSVQDLTVLGSGTAALATFAANAEAVFLKYKNDSTRSGIQYLQDAVEKDDAAALTHLADKAKAYRDTAVGLVALPAPQELAASDLALINAMMRMSEISTDFAHLHDDPLAAMLALQQYLPAAESLGDALTALGNIYAAAGITLIEGTPGYTFVRDITAVAAQVRSAPPL